MKELAIYPSTKKLFKKFIVPIIALILMWFFLIVPDEDIGAINGGGFFTSMTSFIFLGVIGLLIYYFRELSLAKKKPIIIVNGNSLIFPRIKRQLNYNDNYSFSTNESDPEGPMTEMDDFDFLIDRKETYLHIFKDEKMLKKFRATFMNLDGQIMAAFLNELFSKDSSEERESLIVKFHGAVTAKVPEAAKKRIVLKDANANSANNSGSFDYQVSSENIDGFDSPSDVDLKASNKKLALIAGVLYITQIILSAILVEIDPGTLITTALLGIPTSLFVGFILGLIIALFPYQGLPYKRKLLRATLIAIIVQIAFSFIISLPGFIA